MEQQSVKDKLSDILTEVNYGQLCISRFIDPYSPRSRHAITRLKLFCLFKYTRAAG